MKKLLAFIALASLFLTSCVPQPKNALSDYDYSEMDLSAQLSALRGEVDENRPIALITTCRGEIRIALFPEYAPETVAAFIARVEEGFYDGSIVPAIQRQGTTQDSGGVFFQAGLNSKNLAHPDVIDNEYSVNMWPFRGAVGAYGSLQGSSDSRFFVVHGQTFTEEEWAKLRSMKIDGENTLPEELLDVFEEVGVAVTLSGFFTFFGQVISEEGFKTVEDIVGTPTDRVGRPQEEIRIISIVMEN